MAESPIHASQAEHCWQDMQQQHVARAGCYALADDTRNSANSPSRIYPLDQSHTGTQFGSDQSHTGTQFGRSDQPVAVQNGAAAACVSLDRSSPVPKDIPHEFRVLLNKIAEKLDDENITSIAFIHQVPSSVKKTKQALPCFEHLHAHGVFSWKDTEPLKKLLRDIQRHDLVTNLVEEYEVMREEELKLVKRRPFVRQNCSEPSPQSSSDHFTPPHRNNSLPSTVMPLKPPQKPVEETGDSLSPQHSIGSQESEVTQPLAAMDIKEEHSELIDEDWDVVNPEDCYRSVGRGERSQSAADIAAPITGGEKSSLICSLPVIPSMGCKRWQCKRQDTSHTTKCWVLQVKELLPSLKEVASPKCQHAKLHKMTIELKSTILPKHKLQFTIHPQHPEFLSLEVTVITKYAIPNVPDLSLTINIRTKAGLDLKKHSINQPLQSFHLHQFLSIAKLRELPPSTKIVIDIQAKIVPKFDYVVIDKQD